MRKPRIEDLLRHAPKLPVGSEHNIPPFAKFDDELLGQARPIGQNNLGGLTPLLGNASGGHEVFRSNSSGPNYGAVPESPSREIDVTQLATKKDSIVVGNNMVIVAEGPGATCKKIGESYGECTVYGPAPARAIEAGVGESGTVYFPADSSPQVSKYEGVTCWIRADPSGDKVTSGCEVFKIGIS